MGRPKGFYSEGRGKRRKVRPISARTGRRRARSTWDKSTIARTTGKASEEKYWMKEAFKEEKKGALHRELGIPEDQTIPYTLLDAIDKAEVGDVVENPTTIGKRRIPVSRRTKQRVTLARTAVRVTGVRTGRSAQ